MTQTLQELKYTKEHEWTKVTENGEVTIGITDHAQKCLGDVTFVELPEVGSSFKKGAIFGTVESVKAASDLYMPIAGTITAVNEHLMNTPEAVNQSPYESGWMIRVKADEYFRGG